VREERGERREETGDRRQERGRRGVANRSGTASSPPPCM